MKTAETSAEQLHARIVLKGDIEARIQAIKQKKGDASIKVHQLERELIEARQGVQGYTNTEDPRNAPMRAQYQDKVKQISAQLDELRLKQKALQAEQDQLERVELPRCLQATDAAEVLAYQGQIAALERDIDALTAAIDSQRQVIQSAKAAIPSRPDRSGERADLLADIAMGKTNAADLDELDAQAKAECQACDAARTEAEPKIRQAEQTIEGLERRVAALRQQASALQRKRPQVLEQYLMTEAERIGARYVAAAQEAREQYTRLRAIERMLEQALGRHPQMLRYPPMMVGHAIPFPACSLNACREHVSPKHPNVLFGAGLDEDSYGIDAAVEAERQRLGDLGIELVS